MIASTKPPSSDANKADFARSVERARADVTANRSVAYEKVRHWLLSWGMAEELPPPEQP
jgi:hypothetical protein